MYIYIQINIFTYMYNVIYLNVERGVVFKMFSDVNMVLYMCTCIHTYTYTYIYIFCFIPEC